MQKIFQKRPNQFQAPQYWIIQEDQTLRRQQASHRAKLFGEKNIVIVPTVF